MHYGHVYIDVNIYYVHVCSDINSYVYVCNDINSYVHVCDDINSYVHVCNDINSYLHVCNDINSYLHVCNDDSMMQVFAVANAVYWRPTDNMRRAACGVMKAAYSIRFTQKAVNDVIDSFKRVDVTCNDQNWINLPRRA